MKYSEMKVEEHILKAITDLGFDEPTEIQDFGIPIIEKIVDGASIQALIVAPTRELAEQISRNLKEYSKYRKTHVAIVYGGVGYEQQIFNIRKAEIVVGTPGRLLDHLRNGNLFLNYVKTVVLDEADKMFEMGFIEDVQEILSHTPKNRQTLMFSATVSYEIQKLIETQMKSPALIKTKEYVEKSLLKQVFYDVPREQKFSLLVHLIQKENPTLGIVFCATRRQVDFVSRNLYRNGVNSMPLHGGLSQAKRNSIMDDFRAGKLHILVASDVAARGLDIKNVSHIFNFSIPKTPKEYIHRIGRTARMGMSGIAVNLLDQADYDNFNRVLEDHTIQVEQLPLPNFKRLAFITQRPSEERPFNRGFGRRDSSMDSRPRYGNMNRYRPPTTGRRY
ncbi:MAG: DEAD/DEAH box helicase [Candidatus Aenigmarchaeota archaeon]|nr:DEAD/DEAH box helicase [Candidatus Aenigmarchaeota archaeon]